MVICPVHPEIPNSLLPTSSQMVYPPLNWVYMFPFPQIRENLIRWEGYFYHVELLRDLFARMVNDNLPIMPDAFQSPTVSSPITFQGEDDISRKGLIAWGEPSTQRAGKLLRGFLENGHGYWRTVRN